MERQIASPAPLQAIDMNRLIETGASVAFDLNRCDFVVQGTMLFIIPKRQNLAAAMMAPMQGNVYPFPYQQPTETPAPKKRGRGRPPGAKNRKKKTAKVAGKRGPGRPPGAKNKPKAAPEAVAAATPAPAEAKPAPQTITHEAISLQPLPPEAK